MAEAVMVISIPRDSAHCVEVTRPGHGGEKMSGDGKWHQIMPGCCVIFRAWTDDCAAEAAILMRVAAEAQVPSQQSPRSLQSPRSAANSPKFDNSKPDAKNFPWRPASSLTRTPPPPSEKVQPLVATVRVHWGVHYEYCGAWRSPYLVSHREIMTLARTRQLEAQLTRLNEEIRARAEGGTWFTAPPAALRKAALEALPAMDRSRLNIALVGPPGMGKSSLVNALLSAQRALEGSSFAAAVSSSAECTQAMKRYDLLGTSISIWDLPGGGTPRHPAHTFVTDKHLAAFDVLFVLMEGRFTDFHDMVFRASTSKFSEQRAAALCVKGDSLVLQELRGSQDASDKERKCAFEAVAGNLSSSVSSGSRGRINDVFVLSSWALAKRLSESGLLGSLNPVIKNSVKNSVKSQTTTGSIKHKDSCMHEDEFVEYLTELDRNWRSMGRLVSESEHIGNGLSALADGRRP